MTKHIVALSIAAAVGCGKPADAGDSAKSGGPPTLTADRVAPVFAGLTPTKATEADVLATFPSAKSEKLVENGDPSDELHIAEPAVTIVTTPPGKDGRVVVMTANAPGLCDWVKANLASLPGSRACPNNHKTGEYDDGNSYYYCLSAGDTPIFVSCGRDGGDHISYRAKL